MRLTREIIKAITRDYFEEFPNLREELYKFNFEELTPKIVEKIFRKIKRNSNQKTAMEIGKKILELK